MPPITYHQYHPQTARIARRAPDRDGNHRHSIIASQRRQNRQQPLQSESAIGSDSSPAQITASSSDIARTAARAVPALRKGLNQENDRFADFSESIERIVIARDGISVREETVLRRLRATIKDSFLTF
jgi:hypothetical protein